MKTPKIKSIGRSPLRLGFLLIPLALACFALPGRAKAAPPTNTSLGVQALQNNTTGTNDTALGYQALRSNTTGFQNTATGSQTLLRNTTGANNTAVGYGSLFANTTSGNNTAVGVNALSNNTVDSGTAVGASALSSNTTGAHNTAVGNAALASNTTASNNTAIGFAALVSNTTGVQNTGIGSNALLSNTTGARNTAVGNAALIFNTTGVSNTADGNSALNQNTEGSFNTASGVGALFSNTTGILNVAFGDATLFSNTTGSYNTAFGTVALENNPTGINNTVLGFAAGSNLHTGNNNIDIGNYGVDGESNTIRIGGDVGVGYGSQTATFITGISGTAVVGDTVVVDGNGQLGTVASSKRFKKEIKPMDKTSEAILALKPVSFQYKSDSKGTPQFGLIAEEVAQVNPDLVVRDRKGEIYSVRYEAVNAMLLNEFLREHRQVQEQDHKLQEQGALIAKQQKQIEALTVGLQKVSAQVEMSGTARQMVVNNQ